jgi:hypothetical protein
MKMDQQEGMSNNKYFGHIVVDVYIRCHYIIMMSWHEQRAENPCTEGLTN